MADIIPDTDKADVAKIAIAARFAGAAADHVLKHRGSFDEASDEWIKYFEKIYKAMDKTMYEAVSER